MDAVLHFPLRGEWMALRTPARRVPSHGTDFFGQRFAFDFVRPTGRRWAPFGPPALAHAYGAVRPSRFAAWAAPIHAAAAGRVLAAADGWPDGRFVNALWDLVRLRVVQRWRPLRVTRSDWRPLAGNSVLVEGDAGVVLYAHLRRGSVRVRAGDLVAVGDRLGEVGHSGRSTMPHLHVHLMDRADPFTAIGLPCRFTGYERRDGGRWIAETGVPGYRDVVRGRPD